MLLQLLPYSPFEAPRTERLIVLEQHIRRKSYGEYRLADYVAWLTEAGMKLPTRRTLHADLSSYAAFCDDIQYGEQKKSLFLLPSASRDAVGWLMGQAWLTSPLKPNLSSACLRCLLMAQQLNQEVRIFYRRLQQPNKAWKPEGMSVKVLRIIAGTDGGYMQVQQKKQPERININLLRMDDVEFTGISDNTYPPEPDDPDKQLIIQDDDDQLLDRLNAQYTGFQRVDKHHIQLTVPDSQALMMNDLLYAHIRRTHDSKKQRECPEQYKIETTSVQWRDKKVGN